MNLEERDRIAFEVKEVKPTVTPKPKKVRKAKQVIKKAKKEKKIK